MDCSRVTLKTNPVFRAQDKSVDFIAFPPPPFSSFFLEEEQLRCFCPVCALRHYVNRTKALRKSNQLFVSCADSHKGKPISRQRLSHRVVEAIICYNSMCLSPPEGLRTHSTRGRGTPLKAFQFRTYVQRRVGVHLTLLSDSIGWMLQRHHWIIPS